RAEGRLRALVREKQEAIAPPSGTRASLPPSLTPGSAVRIVSLEREGEIVAVRGDKIHVRMGAATFTVARDDLAAAGEHAPAPPARPKKSAMLAALAAASRSKRVDEPSDASPP